MSHNDLHNFRQGLLENESFIRWVRSEFREDDEVWSVFIDQNIERSDEINEAIRWIRDLNFAHDSRIDKDRLWERISTSASLKPAVTERRLSGMRLSYIATALAAACLLFFLVFRSSFTSVKVESGLAQEVAENLPDGSMVHLDAESRITYNKKKWSAKRQLDLQGLAFFEVKKGSNFIVSTPEGRVTVLGTSFSVESRHGRFEVICRTGRVEVTSVTGGGAPVILGPGDKVRLENGQLLSSLAKDGVRNEITWLDGMYTFESAPLSEVTLELQRQFGVTINLPADAEKLTYTGFFRTTDLDSALLSVTWPLKLKYRTEGKKVEITQ